MDADEHETANLDNIPVELFWHVAEYLEKEDLRSLRFVSKDLSEKAFRPFTGCQLRTLNIMFTLYGHYRVHQVATDDAYIEYRTVPRRLIIHPPLDSTIELSQSEAALQCLGQGLKNSLTNCREIVLYHVRRRSMSVGPFRVAIESEMKHNEQNLHKLCCVLAESRIEVRYLNLFLPLVVEPELQFIYLNLEVNCKPLPDGIFTVWGQLRQLHVHEPEDNKAFRYVRNLVPVILANAPRLEEYRLSGSKDRSVSYTPPLFYGQVWEGSPWPSPPPLKSLEFNDPWINLQDMLAFLQWVGNTLEHVRFYHARCIRSDFKWSDILQFMKEGCPMLKYVSLDSVHRDWLGGVEPIRWQGSAECEGPHDRERMLEGLDRMIVATLARMI